MVNPSPQAVAAIRAKILDWAPTNAAIAVALNAPAVANPAPQTTLPKPFAFGDVFGLLSDASVAAIRDTPNTTDLIDKVNAGDRAGVGRWVAVLGKLPAKITPAEAAALMAVLQATQPDPAWPAQISWAVANLGRPVDTDDVAASRPGV